MCPQARLDPRGPSRSQGAPGPVGRKAAGPGPSVATQASAPARAMLDICSTKVAPAGRRAHLGPGPSLVLSPWQLQPECSSRKLSLGFCCQQPWLWDRADHEKCLRKANPGETLRRGGGGQGSSSKSLWSGCHLVLSWVYSRKA